MKTKVPLLCKSIKYIENSNDDKIKQDFIKELASSNSSIILFYVYSKLLEMKDKYEGNTTFINVTNAINDRLNKNAEIELTRYDETRGKLIKK